MQSPFENDKGDQEGLDATRYSGHSLRRVFLTSAAMNRADVLKMVAQLRHANINTIVAYLENQQLFNGHAGEPMLQPATIVAAHQNTIDADDSL